MCVLPASSPCPSSISISHVGFMASLVLHPLCLYPPTLLKAAQYLTCGLPLGFHQVSHGIVSHMASSPCVWSLLLSALQLSLVSGISELSLGAAASLATGAGCCLAPIHHVSCCPGQPAEQQPALPSPVTLAGRGRVCPHLTPSDGLRGLREHYRAAFRLRAAQARLGIPRAHVWV